MHKNELFGTLGNNRLEAFSASIHATAFELGSTTFGPATAEPGRLRPAISIPETHATGSTILVMPGGNCQFGYQALKRVLDVVGSLALLIVLSPIMLTTLLVLCVTTKGRPIFVQERVGRCGRLFRMFKFRTMCLDAHARQQAIKNEVSGPVFKNRRDPRITPLGRMLRQFSIDELPQLINVLRGDMSLVGPRPPIMSEVVKYEPWQRQRLAVKPGLTCLWQVSGRSEIGFEDWIRMDLWYINHQSLLTDLKLLVLTPWCVISRRGAY